MKVDFVKSLKTKFYKKRFIWRTNLSFHFDIQSTGKVYDL